MENIKKIDSFVEKTDGLSDNFSELTEEALVEVVGGDADSYSQFETLIKMRVIPKEAMKNAIMKSYKDGRLTIDEAGQLIVLMNNVYK